MRTATERASPAMHERGFSPAPATPRLDACAALQYSHPVNLLDRYIFKEVLRALLAVFAVLMTVFLSQQLVRFLGDAAEGKLPLDLVLSMLGFKSLSVATLILPLSLFIAIIVGLGRLYKDSEMVVMSACGASPWRLLRSILTVALPVAAALVYLAQIAAPWAQEQEFRILDRAASKTDFSGLVAGRFLPAGGDRNVYYLERLSEDKSRAYGLFAQVFNDDRPTTVSAREGFQRIDPETKDRFLVGKDGYRYDGLPGDEQFRIIEFRSHGVRIQRHEPPRGRRKMRAVPTVDLLGSDDLDAAAELQWRWSIALQALVLALLAIPLSHTDPRQGRFGRVFSAILAYFIYTNLMTGARAWLEQGTIPPWLGLWWVHAAVAASALLLMVLHSGLLLRVRQGIRGGYCPRA
jgi:lipopolysaccharide export system permease protein